MTIKVIEDGPAIVVTQSEYLRLLREYEQHISYMVNPPTFEEFVRSRANRSMQEFGD